MNMRLFALQRISYDGSTTPANRFSTAYRNGVYTLLFCDGGGDTV